MNDELYKKIEKKTKVDKDTIVSLANRINDKGIKDTDNLNYIIDKLSKMTGKSVSDDLKDKIINTILSDKVPKDIDKMF